MTTSIKSEAFVKKMKVEKRKGQYGKQKLLSGQMDEVSYYADVQ